MTCVNVNYSRLSLNQTSKYERRTFPFDNLLDFGRLGLGLLADGVRIAIGLNYPSFFSGFFLRLPISRLFGYLRPFFFGDIWNFFLEVNPALDENFRKKGFHMGILHLRCNCTCRQSNCSRKDAHLAVKRSQFFVLGPGQRFDLGSQPKTKQFSRDTLISRNSSLHQLPDNRRLLPIFPEFRMSSPV